MTVPDDDELRALRRRAFGPGADIHLDPAAQRRLRELEAQRAPVAPRLRPAVPDAPRSVAAVASPEPESEPEPYPEAAPEATAEPSVLHRIRDALAGFRPRRSSVLIALGAAVVLATLGTLLIVVQRAQTAPLAPSARQVARLAEDGGYRIPRVFDQISSGGGGGRSQAYREFHGLRLIAVRDSDRGPCLIAYRQKDVADPDSYEFQGRSWGGCSAGAFPATAQMVLAEDGVPLELAAAFPHGTALQFVYDRRDDEVVVFATR